MDLMLLEDNKYGKVPTIITNLMDCFKQHNLNPDKNDIIVGFTYLLMIEYGFVIKDYKGDVTDCDFNYQRLLQHSKMLPEKWKSSSTYQIEFVLKSVPGLVCKMIGILVSDDLLINCTIPGGGCFSLLLDPLTYFTSSKIQLDSCNYQNLDKLSFKFKEAIGWPAKFTMIQMGGGICACLQHLPYELFMNIMMYLTTSELVNLAKTSYGMCVAINDETLWIRVLQDFYKKEKIHKTNSQLRGKFHNKYVPILRGIIADFISTNFVHPT